MAFNQVVQVPDADATCSNGDRVLDYLAVSEILEAYRSDVKTDEIAMDSSSDVECATYAPRVHATSLLGYTFEMSSLSIGRFKIYAKTGNMLEE